MGLDAQARRGAGGDHAEEQQEGRGETVEITNGHDTHLEFRFRFLRPTLQDVGSGAVRLDNRYVAPSEHRIDQQFCAAAMRFRRCEEGAQFRTPSLRLRSLSREAQMPSPAVAKAPAAVRPRNSRKAGARRSKRRSKFARDMTHTFQFEPQGSGAVSYLNSAQIGMCSLTVNGICTALRCEIMVMP